MNRLPPFSCSTTLAFFALAGLRCALMRAVAVPFEWRTWHSCCLAITFGRSRHSIGIGLNATNLVYACSVQRAPRGILGVAVIINGWFAKSWLSFWFAGHHQPLGHYM